MKFIALCGSWPSADTMLIMPAAAHSQPLTLFVCIDPTKNRQRLAVSRMELDRVNQTIKSITWKYNECFMFSNPHSLTLLFNALGYVSSSPEWWTAHLVASRLVINIKFMIMISRC